MKTRLIIPIISGFALALMPLFVRAQDAGQPSDTTTPPPQAADAGASDNTPADQATKTAVNDETNAEVTLKEMMATDKIVTNTVGIVLVKISPELWAGKYEVTQESYLKVMHANPSAFSGMKNPVDSVRWSDAMAFCQKLTAMERAAKELPDGYSYSLPTEAQWRTLVADASLNDAVMKLNGNYSSTAPAGSLGPNSLGLCDTRGNVMEWCLDSHDPAYHVLRGGAWDTIAEPSSRLEFRWYSQSPNEKQNDFGFRVVLEPGGAQ
jgi:formylglycine-generating enzyme required for sulfatase activity